MHSYLGISFYLCLEDMNVFRQKCPLVIFILVAQVYTNVRKPNIAKQMPSFYRTPPNPAVRQRCPSNHRKYISQTRKILLSKLQTCHLSGTIRNLVGQSQCLLTSKLKTFFDLVFAWHAILLELIKLFVNFACCL